tara:strand:+ start:92 stop:877 length:786 start_codon:yes stop_codon:yes gene_type:complete
MSKQISIKNIFLNKKINMAILFSIFLSFSELSHAIPDWLSDKIPDTDFRVDFTDATAYETDSLLMKFNLKTNDLSIGPYTGTWKNRKRSSKFLAFGNRKSSTDIVLVHDKYGTWNILCSGQVKEFDLAGLSFDREGEFDYKCVMQSGDKMATLLVMPYKKPKFLIGEPIQNRDVLIALPDGRELEASSIHRTVGNKRELPSPVGFAIKSNDNTLGGLGRLGKKNVILLSSDVVSTQHEHYVFMSALGLWFFKYNDGKSGGR